MGDIADFMVEQMIERGLRFAGNYRPVPVCANCKTVCYWSERRGKWTLFENGMPHVCKQVDERSALDGFESLK